MRNTKSKRKQAQRGEDDRLVEIWNRESKRRYASKDQTIRVETVARLANVSPERVWAMLERRQKRKYNNWRDYNPPAFGRNSPIDIQFLGDMFYDLSANRKYQ